jgi:hypothetical protein
MHARALTVGAVLVSLMTCAPATAQEAGPEKRYRFEMDQQPWSRVFDWLTETTGKPLISQYRPTGTFTFKGPPGKEYTLGEIIDILNDSLKNLPQKYRLVRRERSFTLLLLGEKPDPRRLRTMTIDELSLCDDDLPVRVIVRLRMIMAEDVVQDVECKVGPLGSVVALGDSNTLVIVDTADNLRRIVPVIQKMDETAQARAPELRLYEVPAGNAEAIAATLREAFKDSKPIRIAAIGAKSIAVYAAPDEQAKVARRIMCPP